MSHEDRSLTAHPSFRFQQAFRGYLHRLPHEDRGDGRSLQGLAQGDGQEDRRMGRRFHLRLRPHGGRVPVRGQLQGEREAVAPLLTRGPNTGD